jgi:DNA-binding PadR family transcriptional regulator
MTPRSGLALAVLSLAVERPVHPYRMQQLIRERHKDKVINVGQRSQLYKTIDRLVRDGLLTEHATERASDRPERTVYAATDAGREAIVRWTVDMLAAPRPEFGEFAAALAHLPMVTPQQAREALARRLADRRTELAAHREAVAEAPAALPRLVLLEDEYVTAHLETDIAWIGALVDDLDSGALSWTFDEMVAMAEKFTDRD